MSILRLVEHLRSTIYTSSSKLSKGLALRNNNNITTIFDEPVPHIGVETLRSTPFRRHIQSLKDTTRKVVDAAKRK